MSTEGRRYHRISVALEVRVRGVDRHGLSFEETTQSANVSRGGFSFETSLQLEMGAELEVEIYRRVPGPRGQVPFLTKGVVVRLVPAELDQFAVGVQFTGPQFPAYSSESTALAEG